MTRSKRAADKAAAVERVFAGVTYVDLWRVLTRLRGELLAAAALAPAGGK